MITLCELTEFDFQEILPLYAAVGWTNYTARPEMLRLAGLPAFSVGAGRL